jgi:hypothetical protein
LTDVFLLTESDRGIVTIDADLIPDGLYIHLAVDPGAPEIALEIASLRRCPDGQVALNYAPLSAIDQVSPAVV